MLWVVRVSVERHISMVAACDGDYIKERKRKDNEEVVLVLDTPHRTNIGLFVCDFCVARFEVLNKYIVFLCILCCFYFCLLCRELSCFPHISPLLARDWDDHKIGMPSDLWIQLGLSGPCRLTSLLSKKGLKIQKGLLTFGLHEACAIALLTIANDINFMYDGVNYVDA